MKDRAPVERLAYTIDEAAEAVGYSPDSIREHIGKGNIIVRYANRKPVVPVDELQAWLKRLPTEPPGR